MSRFFVQHRILIITLLLSVFTLFWFLIASHLAYAQTQAGGASPKTTQAEIGVMAKVGTFIGNFIIYIGSRITWFGGMILNTCIEYFILNTSGLIGNGTPVGDSITVVWTLIRDICNLAFIAGFIYVGISTIINADSASTKRALASIIIAAFLINFSLLIAKLVIDVGNIIAVEIYNQVANGQNISEKFGEILGVTSIYDLSNPAAQQATVAATAGGNIAFYFMATIMLIVAGFVLAAGGILLMIRFVALVLILCFSPLLFAATVFPATAGVAKDLWHKLLNYTFFAPVYLLMLFVSIYLLDSVVYALRGNNKIADAINAGQSGAFGAVLAFGIAIFFLVMSLQISRNFGIVGADKTIAFGNSLRGKAQSVIGRNTVGWASKKALESYDKLDSKASRSKGWRGAALKSIRGTVATVAGGERSLRGTLEAGKKAKFGGSYSYADDQAYDKEQAKRRATIFKETELQRKIKMGTKIDPLTGKPVVLSPKDQAEFERAVANASTANLEEMEQDQRVALVEHMTQAQIDALNKSDNLSETEKDEINEAREKMFHGKFGRDANGNPVAGPQGEKLRDSVSKANTDQLVASGVDFLADPIYAMRLTSGQMDDLKKKLTPSEFKKVADARTKALEDLVKGNNPNFNPDGKTAESLLTLKPNEIANLPASVLISLSSKPQTQLPISALAKIAVDGTLTKPDQKAIRDNIDAQMSTGLLSAEAIKTYNGWLDTPIGRQFGN